METVDIYFTEHINTGRKTTREAPKISQNEVLLVVHMLIFNAKGEMLMQRRQPGKKNFPGKWDVSAGGYAQSEETSLEAALRETYEELGLKIDPSKVKFFATAAISYVIDDFYYTKKDIDLQTLKLQESEVHSVKWVSKGEALKMLKDGEVVDYDPDLLAYLFNIPD